MIYTSENAETIARIWNVSEATVARWKRTGLIPDKYISRKPLGSDGQQVEAKLLRLIESGWLKARPISRMIGHANKINSLMTARRKPDDKRYHINNLDGDEIEIIEKMLNRLQRSIGSLLYIASVTPNGQEYNEVVQKDLRQLLRLDEIDTANLRTVMDKTQQGRLWAFVTSNGPGRRTELDIVFTELKSLLELLSS